MKLFTVDEANELLPVIAPKLRAIQKYYGRVALLRDDARAAATVSQFGGGMKGGSDYVKTLFEAGKLTVEIHEMGIQLKDYTRGLIDFPFLRGERVALLCWQLGEGGEIEWWHEIDGGFAGRQRL